MTIRLIAICLFGLLMTNCAETENGLVPERTNESLYLNNNTDDPLDFAGVSSFAASEEELESVFSSTPEEIETITETRLDGVEEELVLFEGDATLTMEQYKLFLQSLDNEKQYRTNNLVTQSSNVINIVGFNANTSQGLTAGAQTGLRWAVDNWNRINTRFQFNLTFTTNWQPADIVFYRVVTSEFSGRAEFPSGGKPGRFIRIASVIDNQGNQIQEHVAGHELGHAMGLRHTNWFSSNCPGREGISEGADPNGAIHIPGTPVGVDNSSLMTACYPASTQGEFNSNDVIALQFLY